jgi:hypothetical protein
VINCPVSSSSVQYVSVSQLRSGGCREANLIIFPSVEHKISIIEISHNISFIVIIAKKNIFGSSQQMFQISSSHFKILDARK